LADLAFLAAMSKPATAAAVNANPALTNAGPANAANVFDTIFATLINDAAAAAPATGGASASPLADILALLQGKPSAAAKTATPPVANAGVPADTSSNPGTPQPPATDPAPQIDVPRNDVTQLGAPAVDVAPIDEPQADAPAARTEQTNVDAKPQTPLQASPQIVDAAASLAASQTAQNLVAPAKPVADTAKSQSKSHADDSTDGQSDNTQPATPRAVSDAVVAFLLTQVQPAAAAAATASGQTAAAVSANPSRPGDGMTAALSATTAQSQTSPDQTSTAGQAAGANPSGSGKPTPAADPTSTDAARTPPSQTAAGANLTTKQVPVAPAKTDDAQLIDKPEKKTVEGAAQSAAANTAQADPTQTAAAPKAAPAQPSALSPAPAQPSALPPAHPAASSPLQPAASSAAQVVAQQAPADPTTPSSSASPADANVGAQIQVSHHETVSALDKLGLTIATKSADGVRHFDIRLDPPELGRVEVHLSVDDSGRAQASLVVDKPQTLELLQRDASSLNRALTDAGLDLPNNGLNFSLREQHRQSEGGVDQGRGRVLSATAVVQTDASPIPQSLSYAPDSVRLDIRV